MDAKTSTRCSINQITFLKKSYIFDDNSISPDNASSGMLFLGLTKPVTNLEMNGLPVLKIASMADKAVHIF
jgi:hypothetical protein